jgi:hypothetical protein
MDERWPALPYREWADTYATLHLWTQMAGKVRLMLSPRLNHWWNVALYVNGRGLNTSLIPYRGGEFEIQFDFVDQALEIRTCEGMRRSFPLEPQSVAVFYGKFMAALRELGIAMDINTRPQEIPGAIPFDQDDRHSAYDGEYARRFWRILLSAVPVFEEFRARFIGKSSPVHFFWGSFDLACTRFSGRLAPPRKGLISSEAYSHEVISAGFWPGNEALDAAFYAYTVPQPPGLPEERVRPAEAGWSKDFGEFVFPYADMRRAESPEAALTEFLESTYEAGARLAHWDRAALERQAAVRTA